MSQPPAKRIEVSTASLLMKMAQQAGAIVALGFILGFAFNGMNPIGIRLSKRSTPSVSPSLPPLPTLGATPAAALTPGAQTAPTTALAGAASPTGAPAVPAPQPTASPQGNLNVAAAQSAPPPAAVVSPAPVSWLEAKPLILSGRVLLIDARSKAAYEQGHIPGAVWLDLRGTPEEFAAFRKQYPLDCPMIVYCGNTSCALSRYLADKLIREYGYTSVRYLHGGYNDWLRDQHTSQASTH